MALEPPTIALVIKAAQPSPAPPSPITPEPSAPVPALPSEVSETPLLVLVGAVLGSFVALSAALIVWAMRRPRRGSKHDVAVPKSAAGTGKKWKPITV